MPRPQWRKIQFGSFTDEPDSDFPTLSGGPRQAAPSSAVAGWNSAAIRQTPGQQQAQQAQQQQQQAQPPVQQQQQRAPSTAPSQQSVDQFDGQRSSIPSTTRTTTGADEFPPLGGQANGEGLTQSNGFGSSIASPDLTQTPRATNGQQAELSIRGASNAAFQPPPPTQQQAPIGSGQPAPQPTPQHASTAQQISLPQQQPAPNGQAPSKSTATSGTVPPGVKRYTDMNDNEKYGLTALQAAFEARRVLESGGTPDQTLPPAMRNAVFMGQDLNSLGLDLDSPDPLYTTFTPFPAAAAANGGSSGTFDFHDRHMVPDFMIPSSYTVGNVPPLSSRMSAFSDGTLRIT